MSYNNYYIPKDPHEWMYTTPSEFNNTLIDCNRNNSYKIKPIIRLIKHWNISKNKRKVESFILEEKIAYSMMYSYLRCTSYTEYIKEALTNINSLTYSNEIDKAIECLEESIKFEENNMPYSALYEIKKVFPEV